MARFAGQIAVLVAISAAPLVADDEGDRGPFRPEADRNGVLALPAAEAVLLGDRLRLVEQGPGYVADWSSTTERVRWDFELDGPGRFLVLVEYAAPVDRGGALFEVAVAEQVRQGYVHATGSPTRFYPQPMKGTIDLPAGATRLEVRGIEAPRGLVMNLRRIRLVPAEE